MLNANKLWQFLISPIGYGIFFEISPKGEPSESASVSLAAGSSDYHTSPTAASHMHPRWILTDPGENDFQPRMNVKRDKSKIFKV